jgi:hypothetical protein
MTRSPRLAAAVLALTGALGLSSQPATASGPASGGPSYIDVFGGETADLNAFYAGRIGIVMASSPRSHLFMDWRLLHGLPVGADAGKGLSVPCCGEAPDTGGSYTWLQARQTVPGAPKRDNYYIETDRPLPNNASMPNCFGEAFETAVKTLQARVKAYGADSPWVVAWVVGQDAVFDACHNNNVALPALDAAAPAWLKADRAYQTAAQNLYLANNVAAAQGFAAIARDATSPWRPLAPYLVARAWMREASTSHAPKAFAEAHKAINTLAATPAGTYGRDQAAVMAKVLSIREHPDQAVASLAKVLNAPTLADTAAADFRDYLDLNDKTEPDPPVLDWIATIKGGAAGAPAIDPTPDPAVRAARTRDAERYALDHARALWAKTHDVAWLVAALSLAEPGDPSAPALIADAARLPRTSPAYLTAAYNRVRLTIGAAPEAETRAALDAVLARSDLSTSDRNLFTAERLQVAEDLPAFARLSLRKRLCAESDDKSGCVRGQWNEEVQAFNIYDDSGDGNGGRIGLGPEARALIDRLPLAQRTALAADADLPAKLRMDVALTTWTRAVLMGDDGKADALSKLLPALLPQLADDFTRIAKAPPGEDKRFAEYFVLAKVPGLTTDLETYTRPEGGVDDFQGHWADWLVLPPGSTAGDSAPPCLQAYLPDGGCSDDAISDAELWPVSDLVCLTYCGESAFPLRRPDVVAAAQTQAESERKRMLKPKASDAPTPAKAASVWEAILAYAKAHPADPRVPEALYWLVHVSHFGDGHNHSGHRAFDLLHQRYPTSPWAKKTKYYYD